MIRSKLTAVNPAWIVEENDLSQHFWIKAEKDIDGVFQGYEIDLFQLQGGEIDQHYTGRGFQPVSCVTAVLKKGLYRNVLFRAFDKGLLIISSWNENQYISITTAYDVRQDGNTRGSSLHV